MKFYLSIITLFFSSSVLAELMVTNVYQPLPGGMPQTLAYAAEAKTINEEMGAAVYIGVTTEGNLEYSMIFPNWESYGQFQMALANNELWLAFQTKISENPSATQIGNTMANSLELGEAPAAGAVYETRIVQPGKGLTAVPYMLESARHVKSILEADGANVSLFQDALFKLYFVITWPDAAAWGRFADLPKPELQEFMQAFDSSDPVTPITEDIITGTIQ